MHTEVYADGIGEITVSGSTVRIDLVSLSPSERDAANNPKPVFRQRVVMTLDGFANSAELMQKVLKGLVDAGAVSRMPLAGNATTRHDAPVRVDNVSPNFSG
jgi:hypothetical protein